MSDLDPHCIHKQSISLQYLLAPGVKIIKKNWYHENSASKGNNRYLTLSKKVRKPFFTCYPHHGLKKPCTFSLLPATRLIERTLIAEKYL